MEIAEILKTIACLVGIIAICVFFGIIAAIEKEEFDNIIAIALCYTVLAVAFIVGILSVLALAFIVLTIPFGGVIV